MLLLLALLACKDPDDLDGDGVAAGLDCDDQDPDVGGGALSWRDLDGDGYGQDALWARACPGDAEWVQEAGDCDDGDPSEHPGQLSCNCERGDQPSVPWFADEDGDGVGDGPALLEACAGGEGLASGAGDCAPLDPQVFPGAEEVWYDGEDQDCSQGSDFDADLDGFDSAEYGGADCDDLDPQSHPEASELCDAEGRDEDCDGLVNGDDPSARGWTDWYVDGDGDGYGIGSAVLACAPQEGFADNAEDCEDTDPSVNPGAEEICGDGVANDCVEEPAECGLFGRGSFGSDSVLELQSSVAALVAGVDLQGEGVDFVIVGVPNYYEDGVVQGRVYQLASGAEAASLLLSSESEYSTLGNALAVGDLDQDGQQDLAVVAQQHLTGTNYAPRVFYGLGPVAMGTVVEELVSVAGTNGFGNQVAIAGGFVAISDVGARDGLRYGEVYLFDQDPGLEATTQDALGTISWDAESGYLGSRMVGCDLDGVGDPGLLLGLRTSSSGVYGTAWLPTLSEGAVSFGEAELLLIGEGSEQVGMGLLACGDVDGDGYPEVFVNTAQDTELLLFQTDRMGQGRSEAWVVLEGSNSSLDQQLKVVGDLDGDGSLDLVLANGSLDSRGAVEVIYGPWEGGTVTLGEDRFTGDASTYIGQGVAGDERGFWVGEGYGPGVIWVGAGSGI